MTWPEAMFPLIVALLALSGPLPTHARPAHQEQPNPADDLVRQLGALPAALPATARSDGSIDPIEQRRRELYDRLVALRQAALPALKLKGNATAGKAVFASQGCGGCHTLSAAGSGGTVGPNLDDAKPDTELVVTRVTKGMGPMPPFGESLSDQQIADVAAYVVQSTSG